MVNIPPGSNSILYLRNVPYSATVDDVRELCQRYGDVRQIRLGTAPATKGTAYVVFVDAAHARRACARLNGHAVGGRYLIVGFWQSSLRARSKPGSESAASHSADPNTVCAGDGGHQPTLLGESLSASTG